MEKARKARWLAWTALAILALAVPLFLLAGDGREGILGDPMWAIAGVVALHPAAFAGMGAFFTYRKLPEEAKARATVARFALPVVIVGVVLLWFLWA